MAFFGNVHEKGPTYVAEVYEPYSRNGIDGLRFWSAESRFRFRAASMPSGYADDTPPPFLPKLDGPSIYDTVFAEESSGLLICKDFEAARDTTRYLFRIVKVHDSRTFEIRPRIRWADRDTYETKREVETAKHTRLSTAAIEGRWGECKTLLDNGAVGINIADEFGRNALHHAAWRGDVEGVRFLLPQFQVDARCNNKRTALHYAADCGRENVEVVRVLLEAGANRKAKSSGGHTPYDLAIALKHHAVAKLLSK